MHVISILHIDPAYTLYWQNGEKPTDAKQKLTRYFWFSGFDAWFNIACFKPLMVLLSFPVSNLPHHDAIKELFRIVKKLACMI